MGSFTDLLVAKSKSFPRAFVPVDEEGQEVAALEIVPTHCLWAVL